MNPRLHLRADAMSNTALAHAVLRHGIPPLDPYMAGQPLHYHWAYNAVVAGLSTVLGATPLATMVWLGPAGLLVLLLAIAELARCGEGEATSTRGQILALVLALLCLNGWGYVILLGRLVGGNSTLTRALGSGVHGYLRTVVAGYDERLGFVATKALVATSFVWNLAFLAAAFGALVRVLERGCWRDVVVLALSGAAASYANLFVGVSVFGLVGLALAVWGGLSRPEGESCLKLRVLLALAGVVGAGLMVAPYAWATLGGAGGQELPVSLSWPDGLHVRGLVLGLLPLWACVWAVGRPSRPSAADAIVLFVAACLGVSYLVVRAVDAVEVKLLFVMALLLSAYVGRRVRGLSAGRVRLLWLVAASTVPTTLLGLVAYTRAPDPLHMTPGEAPTFAWIDRNTPIDTVVIANERSTLVPVLAHRDLYLPDRKGFHRGARYDPAEAARRTAQLRQVYGIPPRVGVLTDIARELDRPVVLITRGWERGAAPQGLHLVYAAGDMQTWRLTDRGGQQSQRSPK